MDPNIIARSPDQGITSQFQSGEDASPTCLTREGVNDAPKSNAVPPLGVKERRRSTRFQCSGTAQIQAEGSDMPLTGSLTDISLHGCYVETLTTFPLDTLVTLKIEAFDIHFQTQAKVRASYPFVGMGMCFSDVEPGQQIQLNQMLHAIVSQRALTSHPAESITTFERGSANAGAYLEAISAFFRNSTVLSRDEFFAIAKRVRHS
jgi:PilZ domain